MFVRLGTTTTTMWFNLASTMTEKKKKIMSI